MIMKINNNNNNNNRDYSPSSKTDTRRLLPMVKCGLRVKLTITAA
jgi:hypothetical protein